MKLTGSLNVLQSFSLFVSLSFNGKQKEKLLLLLR